MTTEPPAPRLDPAILRERAAQCLRLAKTVPSYMNAETLKRIAGEYLDMARRLEETKIRAGRKAGNA